MDEDKIITSEEDLNEEAIEELTNGKGEDEEDDDSTKG